MELSDIKYKPLSFPNGTIKKLQTHHYQPHLRPPVSVDAVYRECLKNHAASLGGHALDGCGEFMPSPAATAADPTSLKCAACGCHRNFHRRLVEPSSSPPIAPPPPPPVMTTSSHHHEMEQHAPHDNDVINDDDEEEDEEDDDSEEEETNYEGGVGHVRHHVQAASSYFSSAPHMLLALSSGGPNNNNSNNSTPRPPTTAVLTPPAPVVAPQQQQQRGHMSRKRFRTKFSPEQKQRMQELSERLGWRLQKRDEAVVEQWCHEIGVGKGVFKVWMHNNKHNFLGGPRRGSGGASAGTGAGAGDNISTTNAVTAPTAAADGIVGVNVGDGGGEGIGQVLNGTKTNNAATSS